VSDWLSTREAAELLAVSEASVRRWSDIGLLPVRRVGKRRERRFRTEDLERLSERGKPPRPESRPAANQVAIAGLALDLYKHLAGFYDSDAGRLRIPLPFLAEGLRLGQPCFLMADGDVLDAYLAGFRRVSGLDIDAQLAAGRLRIGSGPGATVTEALEFWERELWSVVAEQAPVIRVVGEMASVRQGFASEAEMFAFEALVDQTLKRFPCVALCQYDARKFSGEALLSVLRTHPDIFNLPLGLFVA